MTTHDGTVLAAHLGTAHLAESLTAAIDPAEPQRVTVTVNTYDTANEAFAAFCESLIARNPKGASMATTDPAAEASYYCTVCKKIRTKRAMCRCCDPDRVGPFHLAPTIAGVVESPPMPESPADQVARLAAETEGAMVLRPNSADGEIYIEGTTTIDGGLVRGPLYYFPTVKPAPPTSRETLAANVKRLREARGWKIECLANEADEHSAPTLDADHAWWSWVITTLEDPTEEYFVARTDALDALAKALDTTPAALLTPQETDT